MQENARRRWAGVRFEVREVAVQGPTAVGQVNLAITNVAQASRETEASSNQTFQTASQLSSLSQELLRLVQATPGNT